MWHLALPFDEYFIKFWYPHLQWFQRSTDNCGKIHVRIILGHPTSSCIVHPEKCLHGHQILTVTEELYETVTEL